LNDREQQFTALLAKTSALMYNMNRTSLGISYLQITERRLVFYLCLLYWIAWLAEHGEIPRRSRRRDRCYHGLPLPPSGFPVKALGCGCCLKGLLGKGSVLLPSVKGHYLLYVVPGFLEWRHLVAVFAYVAVTGIVCCQG